MSNVLCGSLPSLLMDQIEITERRLFVRLPFKEYSLSDKFVGGRDSIVSGTSDVSRSIFSELIITELE
jgi:hypothetical protein